MNMLLVNMLGYPTPDLSHPMWADVHVVNEFEHAQVILDGKTLWEGIVAADRVAKLDELEAMDIGLVIHRTPAA